MDVQKKAAQNFSWTAYSTTMKKSSTIRLNLNGLCVAIGAAFKDFIHGFHDRGFGDYQSPVVFGLLVRMDLWVLCVKDCVCLGSVCYTPLFR